MANTIQVKRSATLDAAPGSLASGELAANVNVASPDLFLGLSDTTVYRLQGWDADLDALAAGTWAGTSSLVTVGALDSGSITSGFGNIDIGASTFDTTGAVSTGALTSTTGTFSDAITQAQTWAISGNDGTPVSDSDYDYTITSGGAITTTTTEHYAHRFVSDLTLTSSSTKLDFSTLYAGVDLSEPQTAQRVAAVMADVYGGSSATTYVNNLVGVRSWLTPNLNTSYNHVRSVESTVELTPDDGTSTVTATDIKGYHSAVVAKPPAGNTVTITKASGYEANFNVSALGGTTNTTEQRGFYQRNWGAATDTVVTSAYGFYTTVPLSSGTTTNLYGVYVSDVTGTATNNYAIYVEGGETYLGGSVTITDGVTPTSTLNFVPNPTNGISHQVVDTTFNGSLISEEVGFYEIDYEASGGFSYRIGRRTELAVVGAGDYSGSLFFGSTSALSPYHTVGSIATGYGHLVQIYGPGSLTNAYGLFANIAALSGASHGTARSVVAASDIKAGASATTVVLYDTQMEIDGTVTTLKSVNAGALVTAGDTGTVTDAYGFYYNAMGGTTVTNEYGLYIEEPTQATNNYAIYVEGGESYFGDKITQVGSYSISGDDGTERHWQSGLVTVTAPSSQNTTNTNHIGYEQEGTINANAAYDLSKVFYYNQQSKVNLTEPSGVKRVDAHRSYIIGGGSATTGVTVVTGYTALLNSEVNVTHMYGFDSAMNPTPTDGASSISLTSLYGFTAANTPIPSSGNTVTATNAASFHSRVFGGGVGTTTFTNQSVLWAEGWGGSSTRNVTNAYGVNLGAITATNVTNAYGIYLADVTGATNNYAIYVEGGESYFGGPIGQGSLYTDPSAGGYYYLHTDDDSATGNVIPFKIYTTKSVASTGKLRAQNTTIMGTHASGTQAELVNYFASGRQNGAGTVTDMVLFDGVAGPSAASGLITNLYGLRLDTGWETTGTVTNNYGIYVSDVSNATTNNYAIYVEGGKNSFNGTTTFTGGGIGVASGAIPGVGIENNHTFTYTAANTGTWESVGVVSNNVTLDDDAAYVTYATAVYGSMTKVMLDITAATSVSANGGASMLYGGAVLPAGWGSGHYSYVRLEPSGTNTSDGGDFIGATADCIVAPTATGGTGSMASLTGTYSRAALFSDADAAGNAVSSYNYQNVSLIGVEAIAQASNTATAVDGIAVFAYAGPTSTGTFSGSAYSFFSAGGWYGAATGGTIVSKYGLYSESLGGGTVTNEYGVYIEEPTSATNNYAIYVEGGDIELGGGTITGTNGTITDTGDWASYGGWTSRQQLGNELTQDGVNAMHFSNWAVINPSGTVSSNNSIGYFVSSVGQGANLDKTYIYGITAFANTDSGSSAPEGIYATYSVANSRHTSGTTSGVYGVWTQALAGGSGGTTTKLRSVETNLKVVAGATVTDAVVYNAYTDTIDGTITDLVYFRNQIDAGAAATTTNLYGFKYAAQSSGTITNEYGLYIEEPTQATNDYAIYVEGGYSYLGDRTTVERSLSYTGGLQPDFEGDIVNSSNTLATSTTFTVAGAVSATWDYPSINTYYVNVTDDGVRDASKAVLGVHRTVIDTSLTAGTQLSSIYGDVLITNATEEIGTISGRWTQINYEGTAAGDSVTLLEGYYAQASSAQTGGGLTVGEIRGGYFQGYVAGSVASTATNVSGIRIGQCGAGPSTATVTNTYAIWAASPYSGGTTTNAYGLYIGDVTGATNNYAIYVEGGDSYLGGTDLTVSATGVNSGKIMVQSATNGSVVAQHESTTGYSLFSIYEGVTQTSALIQYGTAHSTKADELWLKNFDTDGDVILSGGGGGTKHLQVTSLGSVVASAAALGTTATDGFLYVPTCAGAPTGTPTTQTGTVALVFDTTNNNLYVYDAAWIKVAMA